jgi:sugar (pentulose or hexulose) kinase
MSIVAGVDFGTLSVRVSIVDSERGLLATALVEYGVLIANWTGKTEQRGNTGSNIVHSWEPDFCPPLFSLLPDQILWQAR